MKELSGSFVRSLRSTYGAASSMANSPVTVSRAADLLRDADPQNLRASLGDDSPKRSS